MLRIRSGIIDDKYSENGESMPIIQKTFSQDGPQKQDSGIKNRAKLTSPNSSTA